MITLDTIELLFALLALFGSVVSVYVMIRIELASVKQINTFNSEEIRNIKSRTDNKNEELQTTLSSIENKLNTFIVKQVGTLRNLERIVNDHDSELKENRRKL
jgi:hypothetical protein